MTESDKKKMLASELSKLGILKSNTETITINCNSGAICDWKETTRHK